MSAYFMTERRKEKLKEKTGWRRTAHFFESYDTGEIQTREAVAMAHSSRRLVDFYPRSVFRILFPNTDPDKPLSLQKPQSKS
jgi:hypothetical protein